MNIDITSFFFNFTIKIEWGRINKVKYFQYGKLNQKFDFGSQWRSL